MSSTTQEMETYREQIVRCAQALALAKNEAVSSDLARESKSFAVKMFTDGNLDKRFQKLQDQMELVSEAFRQEEFEALIIQYVRTFPLVAYDTGFSDGENFLRWISVRQPLSPLQQDFISCQQGRYEVEKIARENRIAHIQFQDICSFTKSITSIWDTNPELWIHLNPIHAWKNFQTSELLDEEAIIPAKVIFFPVGHEIRTAILEPEARAIVRVLNVTGFAHLNDLINVSLNSEKEELAELCQDLVEIGLTAIG